MTHNSSGWKKAGAPIGTCKICKWMSLHPRDKWNNRIIAGESIRSLAKEFGCCYGTMATHAGQGKDNHGNPRVPHFTRQLRTAAHEKEVRAGLDLIECAKEIYVDCKDNAYKAKSKAGTSRDFRDASGCWDPATKALGLLKVDEKPVTQTTNINLSDPFSRIQAYEKYFSEMENDTNRESPSDSNRTGEPILQAEANEEASSVSSKE